MAEYGIGDTLRGGYHVIDVKAGGMGVVYICHQPATGRHYAIKTVRAVEGVDRETFFERFREEVNNWVRISATKRHPNIVDALLYNEDEHWLFLQYVNGPHLRELTRFHPLHPRYAVRWARDIAEGTRVLHEEFWLIHRDLKPSNVLVEHEGLTARITDLGIGKVLREAEVATTIVGTPGYIAPETLCGEAGFRSDIYSFGAVLYRLLTATDANSKLQPTETGTLIPPSRRNPDIPRAFDGVVARCLRADPRARYESFGEVVAALDEAAAAIDPETDRERYRYCKRHDFAWRKESGGGCLFCEHVERLAALTKEAAEVRKEREARGLHPAGPTMVGGSGRRTLTANVRPESMQATMTESEIARASGLPEGGAGRRPLVWGIAAVLVLGLGFGLFTFFDREGSASDADAKGTEGEQAASDDSERGEESAEGDDDAKTDPSGTDSDDVDTPEPDEGSQEPPSAECEAPGCTIPIAANETYDAGKPQPFCEQHTKATCLECGLRRRTLPIMNDKCAACEGNRFENTGL